MPSAFPQRRGHIPTCKIGEKYAPRRPARLGGTGRAKFGPNVLVIDSRTKQPYEQPSPGTLHELLTSPFADHPDGFPAWFITEFTDSLVQVRARGGRGWGLQRRGRGTSATHEGRCTTAGLQGWKSIRPGNPVCVKRVQCSNGTVAFSVVWVATVTWPKTTPCPTRWRAAPIDDVNGMRPRPAVPRLSPPPKLSVPQDRFILFDMLGPRGGKGKVGVMQDAAWVHVGKKKEHLGGVPKKLWQRVRSTMPPLASGWCVVGTMGVPADAYLRWLRDPTSRDHPDIFFWLREPKAGGAAGASGPGSSGGAGGGGGGLGAGDAGAGGAGGGGKRVVEAVLLGWDWASAPGVGVFWRRVVTSQQGRGGRLCLGPVNGTWRHPYAPAFPKTAGEGATGVIWSDDGSPKTAAYDAALGGGLGGAR